MAGGADDAIAALDALMQRMAAATQTIVEKGAQVIVANAQAAAPVRTGTLRRSIFADPVQRTSALTWMTQVAPHVIYGRIQELGGTIVPTRARMLSWTGPNGRRVFAHSVTLHGQFYLTRGYQQSIDRIEQIASEEWGRAIRG